VRALRTLRRLNATAAPRPHQHELFDDVIHAAKGSGTVPTLNEILGDRTAAVLRDGLSALDRSAIRLLLRHPRRLRELQEKVLIRGGPFERVLKDVDSTVHQLGGVLRARARA
jgi:hypothetical protein